MVSMGTMTMIVVVVVILMVEEEEEETAKKEKKGKESVASHESHWNDREKLREVKNGPQRDTNVIFINEVFHYILQSVVISHNSIKFFAKRNGISNDEIDYE